MHYKDKKNGWHLLLEDTVVNSAEEVASESLGAPEAGEWPALLRQGWHQGSLHHAHCCLWTPWLIAKALMSTGLYRWGCPPSQLQSEGEPHPFLLKHTLPYLGPLGLSSVTLDKLAQSFKDTPLTQFFPL